MSTWPYSFSDRAVSWEAKTYDQAAGFPKDPSRFLLRSLVARTLTTNSPYGVSMLGSEADNDEGGGKAGTTHTASNVGTRGRWGAHYCKRVGGMGRL